MLHNIDHDRCTLELEQRKTRSMKSCISLFAAYTMLLTRATFIERKHKACDVSHEGMHSRVKLTDAKTMIEVVIADAALMLSWELLNVDLGNHEYLHPV